MYAISLYPDPEEVYEGQRRGARDSSTGVVEYREGNPYVAPFVSEDECDHEGIASCSRCCPCAGCGEIRAGEL